MSAAVFVVCFRESFEGVMTIVMILNLLHNCVQEHQSKSKSKYAVVAGAATGFLTAFLIGVITQVFLRAAISSFGDEDLIECIFKTIAVTIQTYIGIKILTASKSGRESEWQDRLSAQLSEYSSYSSYTILAFFVTLREGLEAVMYVNGISVVQDPIIVLISCFAGISLSCILGIIVYKYSHNINFGPFLPIYILVLSAGMIADVVSEVEELFEDHFNYTATVAWNVCGCCDQSKSIIFESLYATIGWKCAPTIMSLVFYGIFWICIAGILLWVNLKRNYGDTNTTDEEVENLV